ncbi:tyrosinase tyrosinase: common central domain protein [Rhizoctonia solani AG-3 Rhs1AP]|uniref:Tyrosinase tyrosinase: common central domain protein n=1 Tax=Rhizoctonia solani AG-3 Rhs1AP TaxID=1086054 RepID=A0A0A1UJW0_9AGAM|nr:tyrosinase tyrosinase: common central domain protein [Rhizoctonia solani AG-3 Rhs1AP]
MKLFIALSFAALVAFASAADSDKKCTSLEVRKEWRTFSKAERKAWIGANNCLNKKPSNGRLRLVVDTQSDPNPAHRIAPYNESASYFDDLVYAHMNLNSLIHWTGLFLPWHRVYLFEWTNILREECGYDGVVPYWDVDDFEGSEIWDSDPESGLGSFSDDESDDYTIHDGAIDLELAYPVPHRLRRHYIPYPYNISVPFNYNETSAVSTISPEEVDRLLSRPEGNYTAFQGYLESLIGMHSSVHLMLGGDMGTLCPKGTEGTEYCPAQRTATFSTNDPVFHLHHGNIDRLWWLWQEKSETNKNAYHGGAVQNVSSLDIYPTGQPPWLSKSTRLPTAGMWDTYTIGETLDTRSWPFCYVYDCDVELSNNAAEGSDSERATKRPRIDIPEPEPEPNPSTASNTEPNTQPSSTYVPDPDPSSESGLEPPSNSDPDPYATSDEEPDSTQTQPTTHVERFFAKCPSFHYNSSQHIMAEFYRLCASGMVSRDKTRQRFRDALTRDFNEMYGVDEGDLGAWQRLCRVLVTDVPDEIEGCRKVVKSRFINIVDLVDTHITENPVLQFRSEAELSSYTKTTGKYFPNDSEHAGSLLKFLLRFIVLPTDAKVGETKEERRAERRD